MIRSMTAFAREEAHGQWGALTVEVRSVNHRFLESAWRLPEELRAHEPNLRERLAATLARGKVDVSVRYAAATGGAELELNEGLARQLAHLSRQVDGLLYNAAPVNSFDLLRWPGVLEAPAPDPEQLAAALQETFDRALANLLTVREREGEKLKALLEQRCGAMGDTVVAVRGRLPELRQRLRERLASRLAELKGELDEARLEQELVYFANKSDVDEELDRLEAHLAEVRHVLASDKPVGRRLDFLMQELNREANTLASKSTDAETTRAAVDLKVYIEQMREQVQNIE